MQTSQQLNKPKIFCRASLRQRLIAGFVFLAVAALFGFFALAANGKINLGFWLRPCGFKQTCNLPCPTCGMTTSALLFSQGRIWQSFYTQPAVAFLCCVLAVSAFLALLIAVLGVYFGFIKRFWNEVKTKHIILALIVILAAGWAVTLARTLAANSQN